MICPKCGSEEIATTYHARGCDRESCTCSRCLYGSHNKSHDEHLHRHCRVCSYDWVDSVLAAEAV